MIRALLALAGLALMPWLPAAEAAGPTLSPADRPTYAVGQRWLRDDGDYRLERVERDVYVFSAGSGREVRLTRDLGLVRLERDGTFFEFDPAPNLTWPLAVGRWGSIATKRMASGNPAGTHVILTWRVEGTDDVPVGKTSVRAFRILTVQKFTATGRETVQRFWYAPDVRQFVRSQGDDWKTFQFAVTGLGDGDDRLAGGRFESLAIEARRVRGSVEFTRGQGAWQRLEPGQRLGEGDEVRTAPEAFVELVLPNGAAMTAFERTVVVLNKLEHDPKTGARNVTVHVTTGAVRVVRGSTSTDPSRPSSFLVSTPTGVAAMRGDVNALVSHQGADKESVVAAEPGTETGDSRAFITYVDYVSSGVQTIRPGNFVRQETSRAPSRPAPLGAMPPKLRDRLGPPTE